MGVYAIWPFFAAMALLLAFAATPLFRTIDLSHAAGRGRVQTIDGLRGFLAVGVFFQHSASYRNYMLEGFWTLPPSQFYTLLGQVGVAVFFMITGYLFWGKLLEDKGRPDFVRLYVGRIFRIGPLYLFVVTLMVGIVFLHTGPHLNQPAIKVAKELVAWFALGFFGIAPDLNGYAGTRHLTSVVWTLQFEWWFYLSLLLTAFVARLAKYHMVVLVAALLVCLEYVALRVPPAITAPRAVCAALFMVGMLCASAERSGAAVRMPNWLSSSLAIGLVGTVFVRFPNANAAWPIVLLGSAFFLVVQGCNIFGLLSSRPARRLGEASYGIYLLHPFILTGVFAIGPVRSLAVAWPAAHWLAVIACSVLVVVFAGIAHVAIERPGIAAGRLVLRRIKSFPFGASSTTPTAA